MISKNTDYPEDMKKSKAMHCTVGQLKKFIEENNIPDDSLVLIQRVEDVYFEQSSWKTVKKMGWEYCIRKELINKAKPGGEFHNKEKYPKMTNEDIQNILDMEKDLYELQEEYVSIFSPVKYEDDDNLYLNAHY